MEPHWVKAIDAQVGSFETGSGQRQVRAWSAMVPKGEARL